MATLAQATVHDPDGVENAPEDASQSRPRISRRSLETAKATASSALKVLNVVAEMAENVPYLGAMSKALTAFNGVLEEVDVCKKDCRAAANEAMEFVAFIQKFEAKMIQMHGEEYDELRKAFIALGSVIEDCLETLLALGADSKRRRDRVKLFFKRDDVLSSVNECRDRMRVAKEKFSITVNADTNRVVHEIRSRLLPQATAAPVETRWPLHAANSIFFGRESEVEHAVGLILSQPPARVAVLGPGGIGKTSIARAVLHDRKVAGLYGERRCFVSCEASTTADGIVRKLADALGVQVNPVSSAESARHNLLSYLGSTAGIICLDNLETPWDADTAATEDFLADLSHLPSIALLITSRVTDTPLVEWSKPHLAPITPFTLEAALQTWDLICNRHDEHVVKLIEAVDRVPLAVTLLARLGRTETAKSLWARWASERTDLIKTHGTGHRLNNLGVSIELSLRSLQSEEAIDVLSIICVSDFGLDEDDLSKFEDAMRNRTAVKHCITLLKQLSLVYTDRADGFSDESPVFRVLSPIRHHMRQHHRVSDEFFLLFIPILTELPYWIRDSYLDLGIARGGLCSQRCLRIVAAEPYSCWNTNVLLQTIEMACELDMNVQSRLHRRYGTLLMSTKPRRALSIFARAVQLDEHLKDRCALFTDWRLWLAAFRTQASSDIHEESSDHVELPKPPNLDELQEIIHKVWDLGRDKNQVWDRDFSDYYHLAWAQHHINTMRREAGMPIVRRSGLYSDSKSEILLGEDRNHIRASYSRLVSTSSPPWDLPVILASLKT